MGTKLDDSSPIVVPHHTELHDLPASRQAFHQEYLLDRRTQLLSDLRGFPLVAEIAQTLRPEDTYRLVLPHGRLLQRSKDGFFSGVFYDKKGIAAHARFLKSRPNLMRVAKGVGTQFLLISLAIQLNRVERLLESVLEEFHQDRIAKIQAGLTSLAEATAIEDVSLRRYALVNAVQTLNEGLQKCYLEMRSSMTNLPSPKNGLWDNWHGRKSSIATKKLRPLQESLDSYLAGLAGVAECYSLLDEPCASTASLQVRLQQLLDLDLTRVAAVARLVPSRNHESFPEEPWQRLATLVPSLARQITIAQSPAVRGFELSLDITGKELLEVSHEEV